MTTQATAASGAARTSAGLPRLLPPAPGSTEDLTAHLARFGPRPRADGDRLSRDLIAAVERAGLTGRGGAAFPVHRKLAAVRAQPGPRAVVGNAAESEPASEKDATLLWHAPHLVLDGLQLAAEAAGADRVYLYLQAGRRARIDAALRERPRERATMIVEASPRFLSGQETALINRLNGGPALPTFAPPRPAERGVGRAPTLVQNVETLAHLALIARYGPQWFRDVGTQAEPGSMLVTIHAAGVRVTEIAIGTPLKQLADDSQPVLIGGYHGTWLPAGTSVTLDNQALGRHGAALGAGLIAQLPVGSCGLRETARIVRYLAAESAGQCGPCLNALPRIALGLAELASPRPRAQTRTDLERWAGLAEGRGACRHPDGTVRLVRSALTVFAGELRAHTAGWCTGTARGSFLPLPSVRPATEADWR